MTPSASDISTPNGRPRRRVVHLSTVHPATDARILYREALALSELGYRVTVVGVRDGDLAVGGVAVRGLKAPRGRVRRILTSWWRALGLVARLRADLYHFHDFELLPAALLAKALYGKSVVYDAHEDVTLVMIKDWLPRWLRGPITRCVRMVDSFCARRMDGVVVPTRLLEERYRRLARRVATFVNYPAPQFVAWRDAAWRPWAERRNEVVHLGTLSMRRLKTVVEIAAAFLRRMPGWTWTLLGMHPEMVEWFDANCPGDVRDRLSGLGQVPHDQIADRLCRARIGINYHPLDYAQIQVAIPVKVFEYLACGLPVATTRVPLLVELVEGCPAVALQDEGPESYLEGLVRLASRGDLADLSAEARRYSDERFNCRREARRLAEMYEQILAE